MSAIKLLLNFASMHYQKLMDPLQFDFFFALKQFVAVAIDDGASVLLNVHQLNEF